MTIEQGGNNGRNNFRIAERMAHVLSRFFGGQDPYSAAYLQVLSVLEQYPNLGKDQIFHEVSAGLGKGKAHCSGKPEGELKRS